MSRREQPYIPLYAQDFLTDEKLRECSASSVGVYIMLMCVMHKQEEYGTIILRQKDRQGGDIIDDFAAKLAKHLPFNVSVIGNALRELLDEDVIQMDGDRLLQKRMVRDADISKKRSVAGRKGAISTNTESAAAKQAANTTANSLAKPEEVPPDEEQKGDHDSQKGIYKEIAALYNEICVSFPRLTKLSEARKKAIRARLASGYTLESFRDLFQKAEVSNFLKGQNDRNWQATFDWLIKDTNMAKVIDGNYSNERGISYGTATDRGHSGGFTANPDQFKPSDWGGK
ncbi:MAG: hypothetical protein HFJ86_12195 [Oscillospiraceae bacterium]|jgi:hypothetical protein|nr:hypothetical protein [Oscillospiraceae bacterium]